MRVPPRHPSFADHLRRENLRAQRDAKQRITPIPFAVYLRRINDEDDAARRVLVPAQGPAAPSLNTEGAHTSPPRACQPAAPPAPGPSVPRLGDVPRTPETELRRLVEVTYQVRSLLSRGAMIDLTA